MKRTTSAKGNMKFSNPKRLRRTTSLAYVPTVRRTAALGTGFVDAGGVLACNTTGTISLINTVVQGVSVNQRVGKKIRLKAIQLRGVVNADTTTIFAQSVVCIVRDSRPTGALPAITEIFNTISSLSFLNDANSARFKIIWQHRYMHNGNTTAGFAGSNPTTAINIEDYVKLKGKDGKVVYKALGTGAIDDIDEGAFYLVGFGGAAAGTADCVGNVLTRTRYWDTTG